MGRDHRKLEVFKIADRWVIEVYRRTQGFPAAERFGLQSQVRRAAVSVATNIVEGCARPTQRDYLHFMEIAFASACEAGYLIDLSHRLAYLEEADLAALSEPCNKTSRMLRNLVDALASKT